MSPKIEQFKDMARQARQDLFDQSHPIGRLSLVQCAMLGGDTLVTISLAGSLFFSISPEAADHKVKRIEVAPGKRLSYQRHAKRAEHWFIVAGTAQVTLDGVVTELHPGDSIDIPLQGAHRIGNAGDTDVVLIEVQHGSYFGEDDIVRLEDDFGRVDGGDAAP